MITKPPAMLRSRVSQQIQSNLPVLLSWDSIRGLFTGVPRLSIAPLLQEADSEVPSSNEILPFESIPSTGRNAWVNLMLAWRNNSFQHMHLIMEKNFQKLGPIYRENLGTHSSVNILNPPDVARLYQSEGVFPRRMGMEAWATHRDMRNHKCGVFLLNGEPWRSDRLILNKEVLSLAGVRKFLPFVDEVATDFVSFLRRRADKNTRRTLTVDLYADLFRFTLEAASYVLYGQRLGVLEEYPNAESLRFITAVETMIKTTLPLLYLPHQILRMSDSRLWTDHMEAWDIIFQQADKCIQNIYQEFCLGQQRGYSGIMAELLLKGELPLDSIKANITELMAGGVDTIIYLYGSLTQLFALQMCSLLFISLRLYPVGITVQRYPTKDIILHNYHVPAGTLVQVGLYPMGRSSQLFTDPLRYDPSRWTRREDTSFRALAFGFGSRQCIGRRLAESEMMLFLMHMLQSFQIDTGCKDDIKTVFGFILMPEKPPLLTFRPI
ncbi:cytochrome P450 11B, mitochondrial-like [Bombina bombina]|uniref:cytochrome P450 11B, mitochondrial-like n=1 Tax=Bombina bombina TaxID=8345 RepID=UPI00235B1DB1|nr:cytochrome P450 11B, mitochondrial-like [Bombina bombina]